MIYFKGVTTENLIILLQELSQLHSIKWQMITHPLPYRHLLKRGGYVRQTALTKPQISY